LRQHRVHSRRGARDVPRRPLRSHARKQSGSRGETTARQQPSNPTVAIKNSARMLTPPSTYYHCCNISQTARLHSRSAQASPCVLHGHLRCCETVQQRWNCGQNHGIFADSCLSGTVPDPESGGGRSAEYLLNLEPVGPRFQIFLSTTRVGGLRCDIWEAAIFCSFLQGTVCRRWAGRRTGRGRRR
jgi:hypothetical protein